jgi:hypothetical protein
MKWLLFYFFASLINPLDVKVIKQGITEYVCFDAKSAQSLLQLRIDYSVLQQKNEKLESMAVLSDLESQRLQHQLDEMMLELDDQAQLTVQLENLLNNEHKWYKDPMVYGFVGMITGLALGLTLGYIGH